MFRVTVRAKVCVRVVVVRMVAVAVVGAGSGLDPLVAEF